MRRKKILFFLLSIIFAGILLIFFCHQTVVNAAEGKLFNDVKKVPYNKVGLLLGTAKFLPNGSQNLYYAYRIEAAVSLYKAGKIKYILISGDNGRKDYNEPLLMQHDLMAAGVDSSCIYLDYAGFRTFDSIVRLKEIFGQNSVTVISQPFHNERAVFIASKEGVAAIGFNAKDVRSDASVKVQIRERFARVKVFLDLLFDKQPKYLGQKIIIP